MIGIIIVKIMALLFRAGFIIITLPYFFLKTAFMWFFLFMKPAQTYTDWFRDSIKHVKSDAYPSRPIPKMKFVDIMGGNTDLITIRKEGSPEKIIIKESPFSWLSVITLPIFFFSFFHVINFPESTADEAFRNFSSLFIYLGITITSIWICIISFKIFCKKVLGDS